MAVLAIQHRVGDFDAWKRAFDGDPVGRAENGVTRHAIYRSADDPNYIVIHLEFSSREEAERLLPKLQEVWRRVGKEIGFGGLAGVDARVLDEVESADYSSRS